MRISDWSSDVCSSDLEQSHSPGVTQGMAVRGAHPGGGSQSQHARSDMQTPLEITFKDMPTSEYIESLIRRRVDRLGRQHADLGGCRVVVRQSVVPGKSVSVRVDFGGRHVLKKK